MTHLMSRMMTETNNTPETQATDIVAVSPETNALVEKEMTGQDERIKEATKALVEAIKKRAQSEIKNAQTITRDAYLKAVNNAREAIEENQLIERERIEHSVKIIQKEAQENWHKIAQEITDLGQRLQEATQVAWDVLMKKKSEP